jgi:hypothetical protein
MRGIGGRRGSPEIHRLARNGKTLPRRERIRDLKISERQLTIIHGIKDGGSIILPSI